MGLVARASAGGAMPGSGCSERTPWVTSQTVSTVVVHIYTPASTHGESLWARRPGS